MLYIFGIKLVKPCFKKDSLDFQGHERVGLLSVKLTVVEQDLFTAHHYIL